MGSGEVVRMVYEEPSDRVTSCVNVYGRRGRGMKVAFRTWPRDRRVGEYDGVDESVVRMGERVAGEMESLAIVMCKRYFERDRRRRIDSPDDREESD